MQGRYLKWPENKIEHHPHLWVNVIGDESKNNVVYAKERNQQQSWFSQSPKNMRWEEKKVKRKLMFSRVKVHKGQSRVSVTVQELSQNKNLTAAKLIKLASPDKKWLQPALWSRCWHFALNTYEYWLDSFLPMSGQFIFCRKIRMIQMKRKKFTCHESSRLVNFALSWDWNVTHKDLHWLTSMVIKMGVLMIHQGPSSMVSQHLTGKKEMQTRSSQ